MIRENVKQLPGNANRQARSNTTSTIPQRPLKMTDYRNAQEAQPKHIIHTHI